MLDGFKLWVAVLREYIQCDQLKVSLFSLSYFIFCLTFVALMLRLFLYPEQRIQQEIDAAAAVPLPDEDDEL